MLDACIVTVNWNSGPHLKRLLQSLLPIRDELAELVIVDNASRAGRPQLFSEFPQAKWVQLESNRGFAGGVNEGVAQARSEFVFLLNPDLLVEPKSLRVLRHRADKLPRAAIVSGLLLNDDGTRQTEFQLRRLPTWWSVLSDVLFLDEVMELLSLNSRQVLHLGKPPQGVDVEQPAAAYWLLRKSIWNALGGMDATFYPGYFEDVDYCKRVLQAGWRIVYFDDCPAYHSGGCAVKNLGYSRFISVLYNNLLRYLRKHHPLAYPWLWLPVKVGVALRRAGIRKPSTRKRLGV